MEKVIIRNILQNGGCDLTTTLMQYSRDGKVVFVTEVPELTNELNNLKKSKLAAVCMSNVGQSEIFKLKSEYPDAKTVVFHSGRLIDRFYNEILNVKKNKLKDYFESWDVNVIILSKNEGMNAIMSNNKRYHGKPYHQVEKELYGPKTGKGKKK